MNTLLTRCLCNKHTSIAGIAYFSLAAIDALGNIWFPDAADKISDSTAYLRQAAVTYGLLTAGDAVVDNAEKPPQPPTP